MCLKYWSGEKSLPTKSEMTEDTNRDMKKQWDKGIKTRQAHLLGVDQVITNILQFLAIFKIYTFFRTITSINWPRSEILKTFQKFYLKSMMTVQIYVLRIPTIIENMCTK